MQIECPECEEIMEYYENDASCTCIGCMTIFDVWSTGFLGATLTKTDFEEYDIH